jgi:hypothetical protein
MSGVSEKKFSFSDYFYNNLLICKSQEDFLRLLVSNRYYAIQLAYDKHINLQKAHEPF